MNTSELHQTTVSDIVCSNYHAAGVFREYGIDFCCGGDFTLREACERKGISTEEVSGKLLDALEKREASDEQFQDWSPGLLIDYIESRHHRFVRQKVYEIADYAKKVAHDHGQRHPWNITIYQDFLELSEDMLDHLEEEEKKVFPLIRKIEEMSNKGAAIDADTVKKLHDGLELLHEDHEGAGNLMASIRQASNGFTPPDDACTKYRILYKNLAGFEEDLHKHVHLEKNLLFRKAQALV